MNLCLSRLLVFSAWGMALAAGLARAQETIVFSKPLDMKQDGLSNAMQSLTAPHSRSVNDFNAPKSVFGLSSGAQFDALPGSPGRIVVSPAAARQWQKLLEDQKNWTLLTPAEILGVTTPEKILGVSDPTHPEDLSPEERYLKRLDQAAATTASNSFARSAVFSHDTPQADGGTGSSRKDSLFEQINAGVASPDDRPNSLFGSSSAAALNSPAGAAGKSDFVWGNSFGRPKPLPAPTPEQQAEMDRFRALMDPSASVEKTPSATRPTLAYTPAASASQTPVVNPAGHSYTPLNSNLGKPTGLKPLSGLTGPYVTPTPSSKTASQLPPWLLDPSANSPFQRRF
jgi:hypothetical protein